jgi:hypothetical protein
MSAGSGLLVAIVLLDAPSMARAQGLENASAESRTFGVTSTVVQPIHAFSFTGATAGAGARFASTGSHRYCGGENSICELSGATALPAGSLLTRIELDACDVDSTGQATVNLLRSDSVSTFSVGGASTGFSETPGCGVFGRDLESPPLNRENLIVDNLNSFYHVNVALGGGVSTRFRGVRLFYKLQVSPTPAVATFNDVPTNHPFFPFIEALARAGITTGCDDSPPLFCPDGIVTRKQMAAFLARALGLHWAP